MNFLLWFGRFATNCLAKRRTDRHSTQPKEMLVDALKEFEGTCLDNGRTLRHEAPSIHARRGAYSARSVVAGSTRTARITGGSAASNAAARMVSAGSACILGSVGFTW